MGWIRKIFGRRTPRPDSPPWISPRFLALVVGLGSLAVASFIYLHGGDDGDASRPPSLDASQEKEALVGCPAPSVGVAPTALPGPVPSCDLEAELDQWRQANPDAQVIRIQVVYDEHGTNPAYRVVYKENGG